MTQKDYELLASALRRSADHFYAISSQLDDQQYRSTQVVLDRTIEVCNALESQHKTNPYGFKRSTFLSVAGHSNPNGA